MEIYSNSSGNFSESNHYVKKYCLFSVEKHIQLKKENGYLKVEKLNKDMFCFTLYDSVGKGLGFVTSTYLEGLNEIKRVLSSWYNYQNIIN